MRRQESASKTIDARPHIKLAFSRLASVALWAVLLSGCASGSAPSANQSAEASRYSHLMHNRFYEAWMPRLSPSPRGNLSVPVDVRIDRSGRLLSFKIVRPSGNEEFDRSVAAVAQKVPHVAPPPISGSQHRFDLRIFFDLDVNSSKRLER